MLESGRSACEGAWTRPTIGTPGVRICMAQHGVMGTGKLTLAMTAASSSFETFGAMVRLIGVRVRGGFQVV